MTAAQESVLAVGWFAHEQPFNIGPTARRVFDRLVEFSHDPWQPVVAAGFHICELCQFGGSARGSKNLYIPYRAVLYVAPELIVHYINAHRYQPPSVFCDAVLACPPMRSQEYRKELVACGIPKLWHIDS